MAKIEYVSDLNQYLQCKLCKEVIRSLESIEIGLAHQRDEFGKTNIDNAMSSKICDLDEVINTRKYNL